MEFHPPLMQRFEHDTDSIVPLPPMTNFLDLTEPPRIARLRSSIAAAIPCVKRHESEARKELLAMSFDALLTRCFNWTHRFVPPRPRKINHADGFWGSPVAQSHGWAIVPLVSRIESGEDLTPFLSAQVLERGYVPQRIRDKEPHQKQRWQDKDFVLNTLGIHHLHIAGVPNGKGKVPHGKELLFVEFGREAATLVYAGTHDDLYNERIPKIVAAMRAEAGFTLKGMQGRNPPPISRLRRLAELGGSSMTSVGDEVVPLFMHMGDGTSLFLRRHIDRISQSLRDLEPLIDEPRWASAQFEVAGVRMPSSTRFEWKVPHTSLFLYEETSNLHFQVVPTFR
jgi:hypothetical protein